MTIGLEATRLGSDQRTTGRHRGPVRDERLRAAFEVLRFVAETLGIADEEDLLTRLVGVEDATEHVIKTNQDRVRDTAVATGRHGVERGPATRS